MKIVSLAVLLFAFSVCVFAQAAATPAGTKPIVLGVTEQFHSNVLGEDRTLNIYLPDGYKQADSAKYPVIYLLDGGLEEDFFHVAGLVQFNTFPWVKRLPPSILVGIANVDRRRDLTFPTTIAAEKARNPSSGHSEKFIQFLKNELQPYVTAKYHGNGQNTLIGESLGGLLATQILFEQPQMFDKYVIISPSLWWNDGSMLNASPDKLRAPALKKAAVYLAVEKGGLTPSDKPRRMEVDVKLLAEKLKDLKNPNLWVVFDYLPQEDHATIAHQALLNAFKALASPSR